MRCECRDLKKVVVAAIAVAIALVAINIWWLLYLRRACKPFIVSASVGGV